MHGIIHNCTTQASGYTVSLLICEHNMFFYLILWPTCQ